MGYVEDNLMPGETVTYRAHLHWAIYVKGALIALLGLALVIAGLAQPDFYVLAFLGAAVLVVAAIVWLVQWVKSRTSEFAVTNKRVIIKVGLIRRDTLELPLSNVESVGVDQSITGRIVGCGTIVVIGTGGTRAPFKNIARPLEFRKHVHAHALA
ncbi:MAG TPA: PH domain-containing protein [Methylomirabilota bacterium]|jgi:uncharacterized membrane protein YdbT with pleckstrin-like domain|nr:PH domain-containing protein [Methylomirabilota bacterium]